MQPDHPGWFKRNWKWAVPSGCLLVVMLLFGGCVALMTGAVGMMKNTGAYGQAMTRLREDPAAVALLGEPIDAGWMVSGNVNESGGTGEANYAVPVSGPRGTGKLYVEARKSAGKWSFDVLTLVPDGDGEPVDLLHGTGRPGGIEYDDAPTPDTRDDAAPEDVEVEVESSSSA